MDLVEGLTGALDPGEGEGGGQALQLGAEVGVAEQLRSFRTVEQEQIFQHEAAGAEEGDWFSA